MEQTENQWLLWGRQKVEITLKSWSAGLFREWQPRRTYMSRNKTAELESSVSWESPHYLCISPSRTLPNYYTDMGEIPNCWGHDKWKRNLWNKPNVLCLPYKLYSKRKKVIFKVLFCIEGRTVSQMWQPPLASLPLVKRKMRSGGQVELPKVEPFWGSLCWGSEMLKVEIGARKHKASLPNTSPPHQWDPKLWQIITTKILADTDQKPQRMTL